MASIPMGMRFELSEKEIMSYLLHKVTGLQPISLPCDLDQLIPTDDLYGKKEPWEIFGGWEEKKLYFFTKLKKVSNKKPTSQRFLRNVGTGTWTNKGQRKSIYCRPGVVTGYKRCYRYERKNDDRHGQIWLLEEFVLPEEVVKSDQVKQEHKDYALCVLKKKKMKNTKKKEMCVESGFSENAIKMPPSVDVEQSGQWDFLDFDEIMMMPSPSELGDPSSSFPSAASFEDQTWVTPFP